MTLPERAMPVRMGRVAIVALRGRTREVLVALAESAVVDLAGPLGAGEGAALEALRRLESRGRRGGREAALSREPPDVQELERSGAAELLAGEVEIDRRVGSAVRHGSYALFVGWAPRPALAELRERLRALGAELVELPMPRGTQPPTLLAPAPAAEPFRPLVGAYGAVPYDNLDPTPFVAITYCLMFGVMFADVGDGAVIVAAALALARTRSARLASLRKVWPMIAGPGLAAMVFGALYGECFGPTRLLPALWLAPLSSPTRLLAVAVIAGGLLLAGGYALGIVNRWREGGARLALTADAGVPGLALLLGGGCLALDLAAHVPVAGLLGAVLALAALGPLALGLRAGAAAGAAGFFEVAVGLFDGLLRLFSNVISFGRLAAFGLMHAAIGQVILHAAEGLLGTPLGDIAAGAVFLIGWAAAFALEGLVVAVQALRLEYYELFSRLFVREGRTFTPWRLPLLSTKEA